MEQKKFEAMLVLLVPQVIHLIVQNLHCDEVTASQQFYNSHVYELLEQEDTKLWHLSPNALFQMYHEEINTGNITFPEEA